MYTCKPCNIFLDTFCVDDKVVSLTDFSVVYYVVDKNLLVRRITIAACNVLSENDIPPSERYEQISLFDEEKPQEDNSKERALQEAMLDIKRRFGKNSVIKAKNLNKGGTAIDRNKQIGGHKA